jgi:hypothetical protein
VIEGAFGALLSVARRLLHFNVTGNDGDRSHANICARTATVDTFWVR